LRSRKRRKLIGTVVCLCAVSGVFGLAALPAASADTCVVTVTVAGGQKLTFTVNVPAGTPVSAMSLPVKAPILAVSESCQSTPPPPTTTSAPSTTTSTSSQQGSGKSGGSGNGKGGNGKQPGKNNKPSSQNNSGFTGPPTTTTTTTTHPSGGTAPPPRALRTATGVPTPANPTFAFSLPGAAPIGVPNFFIDSFRIPPFLLPIYQAAGIEYDVPWQVLAAINEIETDYGRNLSVSSAGAVGWMQFLPATWKTWGVDANGDGVADPYNPVDAIFAAGRYLHAAGASKNVRQAIFAYNHAGWYVDSVMLRAKLIGGMPDQLIGSLTGLVQGHFPVAAPAKYADDAVTKLATKRVKGSGNVAIPVASTGAKSTSIFAKQGSPAIAVNDGKIVGVGQNPQLGKFIKLQDETGNVYTYAHLGSIPKLYPVPKPVNVTAADLAKQLSAPSSQSTSSSQPNVPASAGAQQSGTRSSGAKKSSGANAPISLPVAPAPTSSSSSTGAPMVKERLFANPSRPASYAAGGSLQLKNTAAQITSFQNYFSDVLHLGRSEYTLRPLKSGAPVVAGTILGRIGGPDGGKASHLAFMIQPAGNKAPQIDPKPILDGWKLLEATAVYRASGVDPFYGPHAKNPTVGQVLLMSKTQLQNRILADPHVQIYACGRRDIQAGLIDRRVLATIEFLAVSGLRPYVSGLECGSSPSTGRGASLTGTDAAGASGSSVDISKVNNIPILGHQGKGSITDLTIRRLLTLQGAMKPDQIISTMSYKGQATTLSLPDHKNRIQVTFTPLFGSNKKLSKQLATILQPGQWIQLINRISQIPEPVVPIAPSKYAVGSGSGH